MEKRKESLSALKICRFCLSRDDSISTIYDRTQKPRNAVTLPIKILSCLSVEAFPSDKMPTFICNRCSFFMDIFYQFKEICRSADERILQFIQSGSALETVNWPVTMKNIYRDLKRSNKPHVVQAVVEGGATVQFTSQEISNSEDEDDNEDVYNIKIGDGPKDIELVASNKISIESEDQISSKPSKDNEDRLSGSKGHIKNFEDGCWACDACDCTYPLQQLLELHKMKKHRTRTVPCEQCDAKFFTKYDMMTHSVRHSDEMPFQCVACDKKFKRLVLLKRHEKLMHSNIPQLACPYCPATFLSIEELNAHQSRHARITDRTHPCPLCDKKFLEKSSLQRHIDVIHAKKPNYRCEYCPDQFTSLSKLIRHVRSHAGDRPYPCKYCDKSFLKSHHFTRHLRIKHRETIRKPHGPFGQSEYRCEQCSETFNTQDELIYHSAIHATQNLTCPLCQEKFENVDAVTAHIKSHVNGMEFMCDLCELVFTTKEKLDTHLTTAHADELENELGGDESSMELDGDEFEDDNAINVKEEDGEMVVEIKKTENFMLPEAQADTEEKPDNPQSEESELEVTYTDLATVDTLATVQKEKPETKAEIKKFAETPKEVASSTADVKHPKPVGKTENQTASILRKAEEVKRKVQQTAAEASMDAKDKNASKVESSNTVSGASDKSLRLLEKELQELKRTNTRNEAAKAPARPMENLRNRRPQLHTSTPKTRATEDRRSLASNKPPAVEKKVIDRRAVTKENKEPKDVKELKDPKDVREPKDAKDPKDVKEPKDVKDPKDIKEPKDVKDIKDPKDAKDQKETNDSKEEVKKEPKEAAPKQNIAAKDEKEKDVKEKEVKEKETPKSLVKNGTAAGKEENVRRSTRPSKIKDYAKMIRDKSQESSNEEESDNDEEYKEADTQELQARPRLRRGSLKPAARSPAVTPVVATPPVPARKRGRPRKDQLKEQPPKQKKEDTDQEAMEEGGTEKEESEEADKSKRETPSIEKEKEVTPTPQETMNTTKKSIDEGIKSPSVEINSGVVVSPTGQTLKKVPIRALPPGIKPLPLPVGRSMGPGELCEMQIGKKVVKVQKIVMTKAEVEAMAKQGLVEMKDGTMVLKQGIKIPTSDSLKSTIAADKDTVKESLSKATAATPSFTNEQ